MRKCALIVDHINEFNVIMTQLSFVHITFDGEVMVAIAPIRKLVCNGDLNRKNQAEVEWCTRFDYDRGY